MKIEQKKENTKLMITLEGKLDTMTSPELEGKINLSGIQELELNMAKVDYVSSAGLRLILSFQKTLSAQKGKMTLVNLQPSVREVFDMVGYSAILNIK